MNRRQFIKKMIVTTAIIAASVTAISQISPKPPRRPLTNAEKEYIIAQALMTPEGKTALALAMCEPIRRGCGYIGYQEVGRKLLLCT